MTDVKIDKNVYAALPLLGRLSSDEVHVLEIIRPVFRGVNASYVCWELSRMIKTRGALTQACHRLEERIDRVLAAGGRYGRRNTLGRYLSEVLPTHTGADPYDLPHNDIRIAWIDKLLEDDYNH